MEIEIGLLNGSIIFVAGIVAGIINVVAGAGTLITFPTLLALGIPPITANVSNTVGLVPASVTGAYGYRRELQGQWRAVGLMAIFSAIGGIVGGVLLLVLPASAFSMVVPYLLILAGVLSAIQPRIARFVRRKSATTHADTRPVTIGLSLGVLATGVYGGYFGAAQGVVLLALLGILWSTDIHRANGAKNVLAGVANVVSSVIFISSGTVDWMIVLLIGVGSALGGWLGARIGRRLPAPVLRTILVIVALTAAAVLLVT
ncbi:sulfite exporter TauE/SafE family protein [Cryobacterium sp. Y62]|uniref:sulfite exporter TauE/SafE family protein n=1 Tax=Cryobacterium sp. Y62 TaxID=2048284 RepID=UPI000CE5042A|nr:sulfite exporter TauE/SafE family protein [Cryobacterium sp. Y62]